MVDITTPDIPGQKLGSGADDALFLTEFGGMVITAYRHALDYGDLVWSKTVKNVKSDTFPIIGQLDRATEHERGIEVLGAGVDHNAIEVSVDKPLVDAVFVDDFDDLRNYYDLQGPYATQLGQSIGLAETRKIARTHILASRVTTPLYPNGPVPSYYYDANVATDMSKLEAAYFAAKQYIEERDISGQELQARLKWAQYLSLSRYTGIEGGPVTTGSGDRSSGTIGPIAGIRTVPSNNIPTGNITTGNTKYRGNFTTTVGHIGTKMAVFGLNLRGLRIATIPRPANLGVQLLASKISGFGIGRPECSFEIASAVRA